MNAAVCDDHEILLSRCVFPARDYDLAATLDSGQAFRWRQIDRRWTGVIGRRWVCLSQSSEEILAETPGELSDWKWLEHYLQLQVQLDRVLATFPEDTTIRSAVMNCRGLRLLRQDPWECLASFILSSTKQIVQIRQIVSLLCERYGGPLPVPAGCVPAFAFPTASVLATLRESSLRDCKMGFRAPYLLETARIVASGDIDLASLAQLPVTEAREQLLELPGVGRKIADCVLLFAYGFQEAFPVDVWVMKALRELYFPKRRPARKTLEKFVSSYFGVHSGYAQQYLFHYMRTRNRPDS